MPERPHATRDHVVIHDGTHQPYGTLECERCGATERITFPIPISDFVREADRFADAHEHCLEVAATDG